MDIYKAPTLRLKALNKHTHIMYMENVIQNNKNKTDVDKVSRITMQNMHARAHARTHARTHTHKHAPTHARTHARTRARASSLETY